MDARPAEVLTNLLMSSLDALIEKSKKEDVLPHTAVLQEIQRIKSALALPDLSNEEQDLLWHELVLYQKIIVQVSPTNPNYDELRQFGSQACEQLQMDIAARRVLLSPRTTDQRN